MDADCLLSSDWLMELTPNWRRDSRRSRDSRDRLSTVSGLDGDVSAANHDS